MTIPNIPFKGSQAHAEFGIGPPGKGAPLFAAAGLALPAKGSQLAGRSAFTPTHQMTIAYRKASFDSWGFWDEQYVEGGLLGQLSPRTHFGYTIRGIFIQPPIANALLTTLIGSSLLGRTVKITLKGYGTVQGVCDSWNTSQGQGGVLCYGGDIATFMAANNGKVVPIIYEII